MIYPLLLSFLLSCHCLIGHCLGCTTWAGSEQKQTHSSVASQCTLWLSPVDKCAIPHLPLALHIGCDHDGLFSGGSLWENGIESGLPEVSTCHTYGQWPSPRLVLQTR